MKTLILNGSPRKQGNTAALIRELQKDLRGEAHIVSSYYDGISPCVDCRYCKAHEGCSIDDGMTAVYRQLAEYDNLVIASPVYFSELTGSLLALCSRLQTYFCARHFRGVVPGLRKKQGVLVLTGAERGTEERPRATAGTIFRLTNTSCVAAVLSMDTDRQPAGEDAEALSQARKAAGLLNDLYHSGCGRE